MVAVHGGPEDITRLELAERRYRAHKIAATMQGWVEGHDDSHRVRQPVIWWRRWADSSDEVAVVNLSKDSSLGARRGKVEWYNVMRCGIARRWCLL
jgi:hypothetical protein